MGISNPIAEGSQRDAGTHSSENDDFTARVNQLLSELRVELEALQRESAEIELLLRQTSAEVEKLATRELSATNRVRDMELNLDNYSRSDMKAIYNQSHEVQMRLFMMRAQVEQLEAKRNSMRNLQQHIQRFTSVLLSVPEGYSPSGRTPGSGPLASKPSLDGKAVSNQEVISQVIEAQEDERLRVSRQIHDGPAQTMTNLVLRAEICERLVDLDPARAKTELAGLKTVVNSTLQETRRFIFDLRPMILDDLGLEPTLRRYIQQFSDKFNIKVGLTINDMHGRLPLPMEVAIFRITQEALSNVAQHAHANQANVTIDLSSDSVILSIEDDGAGFTADESRLSNPKYRGISTMRQRAEMFGGQISIESAPGKGTRVGAMLPVIEGV